MKSVLRVLARMVGTIVAATFAVFVAVEISIPGGFKATVLPGGIDESSPRARELIDAFNLDGNLFARYADWFINAAQGDFGRSTRAGIDSSSFIQGMTTDRYNSSNSVFYIFLPRSWPQDFVQIKDILCSGGLLKRLLRQCRVFRTGYSNTRCSGRPDTPGSMR